MHNYIDTCCEKLIEMEPVEESCVESDDHESEPTRIVCSTSRYISRLVPGRLLLSFGRLHVLFNHVYYLSQCY